MRNVTRKRLAIAVALLLTMALLAGCGSQGSQQSPAPAPAAPVQIKMGIVPWVGFGPWWIAEEKGLFGQHNLDVELVMFYQDADISAAFAANRIQVVTAWTQGAMKMIVSHNVDARLTLLMDQAMEADAVIAKDVAGMADIKGKKVAFEEGATSDLLLRHGLKKYGLSIDDIEPVYMPAKDAGAAVVAGAVDVAVSYEPYISMATQGRPEYKVIYSGADAPGLIADYLMVQAGFLAQHPEAVAALSAIWQEALDFWQANPDEGNQIVAKAVGAEAEVLPGILSGLRFFSTADNQRLFRDGTMHESLRGVGQILIEQGALESVPDPDDLLAIVELH